MTLFEIVPNLSEGRNMAIIDDAVNAAELAGARVLNRSSDAVHHRSVLTVTGDRRQILDAAIAIATVATEEIDLRAHSGVHPRIGVLDVLPFVPLRDATMEEAANLAREAGARIWEQLGVPSYLYGAAATAPERVPLPAIRSGRFKPDFGTIRGHETAGAIAIGARDILVAFNVVLATGDLSVAQAIARTIRERDGGLRTLRALGFRLDNRRVQVSLNVTDYDATPLHRVVELIRVLAAKRGVAVLGSELIGCLPSSVVEVAARYYLGVPSA